jgi:MFS family permease
MYVMSLHFQDPAGLAMSPLQAGLATLPACAGLVVVTPFVSPLAIRIGTRTVVGVGFLITTLGFLVLLFLNASWGYGLFVLPLAAAAVGMGLSNGCASSAATASVPEAEVGAASGVSNMARYVGASLLVAASAALYDSAASVTGVPREEAVADGVVRTALLLAVCAAMGIALALCYGRQRPRPARAIDRVAAAAAVVHTLPAPPRGTEADLPPHVGEDPGDDRKTIPRWP